MKKSVLLVTPFADENFPMVQTISRELVANGVSAITAYDMALTEIDTDVRDSYHSAVVEKSDEVGEVWLLYPNVFPAKPSTPLAYSMRQYMEARPWWDMPKINPSISAGEIERRFEIEE